MSYYPNDANGDLFRRLESQDFDFSKEHSIEFFAVFATEEEAMKTGYMYVEDKKNGEKLINIETRPYSEGGMELELVKVMHPTYENVTEFEQKLMERISTVDGYFDGWGFLHD